MKQFILMLLLFAMTFGSAAQEATEIPLPDYTCPADFRGQRLDIFGWLDYFAFNTIPAFELLCGVTVNYVEYDDEQFMLDTMRLGNPSYDLLIISSTMVEILAAESLLVPMELETIPNAVNINPSFLNASYDPENLYSVPYMWGSVGIVYKKEAFPDSFATWEDFWTADARLAWIDDQRAMLGIALLNLGYDPNTEDAAELTEARDFLGTQGSNIEAIYESGRVVPLMIEDQIDAMISYSGSVATLLVDCECEDFGYVIPEEGSNIFIDTFALPVDNDNAALGRVFIDYILNAEVNAEISNIGYGSTNQAALEQGLINVELADLEGFFPGEELVSRMFFIEPLTDDISAFYDIAWNDLLAFYGE